MTNFSNFKKHQVQPPTPILIAKDPSPEPVVSPSSEFEFEMCSEENNILDDLLEHVEHEMQCGGDILSESNNFSLGPQNRISNTTCPAPGTEVKGDPQRRCINPLEVGHSLTEHQSKNKMMLETSHEEIQVAQDVTTPSKSNSLDRRRLDSLRLEVPIMPFTVDFEESSRSFLCSNGTQLEVQDENAHITAPIVCEISSSFSKSRISTAPEEYVEELRQQQRNLQSPLDESLHEPDVISEPDLFDEELDPDLMSFVDAAVHVVDEASKRGNISMSKTCLKVKVPKLAPVKSMDSFSLPSKDDMIVKSLQELNLGVAWSTKGLEREKTMNWVPFKPHLTKLNLEETIEEDGGKYLKLISPPADIVQSSQLLFKEPGLRFLDTDEYSEDELEENQNLANLISKPVEPKIPQKRPMIDDLLANLPLKRASQSTENEASETEISTGQLKAPYSGGFSACNALETFLDLRGKKFKRMASPSKRLSAVEIADDPIQTQTQDNRVAKLSTIQVPATPVKNSTHELREPRVPELKPLSWRRSIMAETTMLKTHQSLFAFLERRGSGKLDIIYREMSSDHRNSSTRTGNPEIILNPTTCLIFTNLQALTQKNLPGQNSAPSANSVRIRVQMLAQEYDNVFIIATIPRMVGGFPQSHMGTISAFTGYCASFKLATVTAVWASVTNNPIKTDEAIHAWTWSLISQRGFPTNQGDLGNRVEPGHVTLIHEETSWEHFLRKAGMNPMAAQVVLGMLHKNNTAQAEYAEETWGLSRFVCMPADERISMFEAVVGKRAIERINAVLDSEWIEGERVKEQMVR